MSENQKNNRPTFIPKSYSPRTKDNEANVDCLSIMAHKSDLNQNLKICQESYNSNVSSLNVSSLKVVFDDTDDSKK